MWPCRRFTWKRFLRCRRRDAGFRGIRGFRFTVGVAFCWLSGLSLGARGPKSFSASEEEFEDKQAQQQALLELVTPGIVSPKAVSCADAEHGAQIPNLRVRMSELPCPLHGTSPT